MTLPEAARLHAEAYRREAHDPEKSFLAGAEWFEKEVLPEFMDWVKKNFRVKDGWWQNSNGSAFWSDELLARFKKEKGL